jgi:transcriptional regulator with XRE-family HTH domain
MTAAQIKRIMKDKGITQGDIRRKWKAPKATVSALVNRKFKSDRLEKRLARVLGVTVEQLRGEVEAA